jgi:diguanylate cyclase (GGDEF)-like protein
MSAKQNNPESPSRQEFTHSLQLLERITSWHEWSGSLMVALLVCAIVLLTFPGILTDMGVGSETDGNGPVRALLGLMCIASGIVLYQQRTRLNVFRKNLIEQMDAATKHRVKAEQFYGLSIIDPLTGLYNRRFGEARLQEEIAKADKSGEPLLLLAMDFDRFKQINDNYGHAAGDLALKEFSRRLQRAIRACDVPVRVGGDEFLTIFPECPPDQMQQILARMESIAFTLDGEKIPVSFSHGVAQYQVNDTTATMIRRADERLYAAKANRKSAVETYSSER